MPLVSDYRAMLANAQAAGDSNAAAYFQSQIDAATQTHRKGTSGRDHGPLKDVLGGMEGTIADAALQGATFGFADEIAGVGGGLMSEAMHQLGIGPKDEGFSKGYGAIKDWVSDRAKNYESANPLTSLASEIGGGLIMPLGLLKTATKVPGAVSKGYKTAAKAGALYGAGKSETDSKASLGERAGQFTGDVLKGTAGGLLGNTALRSLSKVGQAVFPKVANVAKLPSYTDKVRTLRREGINPTVGERIGNKTVNQDANILARSVGLADDVESRPQTLYSRLMERANFAPEDVSTGDLSREAVQRAAARFNAGYDRALRHQRVKMPDMDPHLRRIERGYSSLLPHEQRANIRSILDDFRRSVRSRKEISGQTYKRLRSNIGKMAARASKSDKDRYLAPVYKALRATLDVAFRQNATRRGSRLLAELDSKYGAFKLLSKAADNPNAIGTLANRAKAAGGGVDPEFVRLLEAYQDVLLRNNWNSSGTPEGLATLNPLSLIMPTIRTAGAHGSELKARMLPGGLPVPEDTGAFVAGMFGKDALEGLGVK
ncbi:MAG: hypothetical protein P8Y36_00425 [Alphaproteobacteria bacterium]